MNTNTVIKRFFNISTSYSVRIRTLLLKQFYANNNYIATEICKKAEKREMIKYDKLWETMKSKGITQYDLYTRYHMNRSQLNRLRHNRNVEVNT
ncbi:MAG: helix-turn-helix domain-containing protein, partial [Thomasclavelia spiroformis]